MSVKFYCQVIVVQTAPIYLKGFHVPKVRHGLKANRIPKQALKCKPLELRGPGFRRNVFCTGCEMYRLKTHRIPERALRDPECQKKRSASPWGFKPNAA